MDQPDLRDPSLTLTVGGQALIDELEPLWLSLFDWHATIGAAQLPLIDRELSWPRRRALYISLLEHDDAFVVVARRNGEAVGYAVAHLHDGPDDTWPTSDRIGEIESLAVLEQERGGGLGSQLLDVAEAELAKRGATTVAIAVMVGNDAARRFYERRGMVPTTVRMLRLGPRPSRVVMTATHEVPSRAPIRVSPGDVVDVGDRDTDWPAFVLVTSTDGAGWVPSRHLSADRGRATVLSGYDTTELATQAGEVLDVLDADVASGWLWCRNAQGRQGWVPQRAVTGA